MNHASLFTGFGGFDLAAEWMGWNNVFQCEIDEFCQKILNYYWPNAEKYKDVKSADFSIWRGRVDILSFGFPCQPYSVAGKRLGKNDERHLWPWCVEAVRAIQPRYVLGENVYGLLNWNGGLVFEEVQADLEAEGYEVQAVILPACSKNAPHKRERIFFIGYAKHNGLSTPKVRRDEQEPSKPTQSNEVGESTGTDSLRSGDVINSEFKSNGGHNTGESSGIRVHMDRDKLGETGRDESANDIESSGIDATHSNISGLQDGQLDGSEVQEGNREGGDATNDKSEASECSDASNAGCSIRENGLHGKEQKREAREFGDSYTKPGGWSEFPTTEPTICGRNDGFSTRTYSETISKEHRMDRDLVIKGALDSGRLEVDYSTGSVYSRTIRGMKGKKIELPGADCNGYRVHNIYFDGVKKQCRAHQIVWISANGLYNKSKLMIDHINRDKSDNRLCNLRLVDAKGNRENAPNPKSKFTQNEKDLMHELHTVGNMSFRELAEHFECSKSRIHQIVSEHNGIYGITFSKWRNESIKGFGNAVVPQLVFEIFKAIEQYENDH